MLRMYLRGAKYFLEHHPKSKTAQKYKGVYEWLYAEIMYPNYGTFKEKDWDIFGEHDEKWYKNELEKKFNVNLSV